MASRCFWRDREEGERERRERGRREGGGKTVKRVSPNQRDVVCGELTVTYRDDDDAIESDWVNLNQNAS